MPRGGVNMLKIIARQVQFLHAPSPMISGREFCDAHRHGTPSFEVFSEAVRDGRNAIALRHLSELKDEVLGYRKNNVHARFTVRARVSYRYRGTTAWYNPSTRTPLSSEDAFSATQPEEHVGMGRGGAHGTFPVPHSPCTTLPTRFSHPSSGNFLRRDPRRNAGF